MILLDMRTIVLTNVATSIVCAWFIVLLWRQSRNRFAGTVYWVVDFVFQAAALILVVLRGAIPDWLSMVAANGLVIAGAVLGFMGLERFFEKKGPQVQNALLLIVFIIIHGYFSLVQPSLAARNLNLSVALFLVCLQCVWLLWRRVEAHLRSLAFGVGVVFFLYCLASVVRIVHFFIGAHPESNYLQAGLFEALVLVSYQILFILLTYSLVLMVNKRLLVQIETQEEKFSKAFHSSPYAITLTRLSDGTIADVNETFVSITGYDRAEVLGKKTTDLHIWGQDKDRAAVVDALSSGGKVQGMELRFRKKNAEAVTGLFSAEVLAIDGEKYILSSVADITANKQTEDALRRSEENFRRSIDDSPLGQRIVTGKGETVYANRALLDIYGYDILEELQTTPTEKRYTPQSHAEFLIRREKRRQGVEDPTEYGIDIVRKNGEVRHLQVFRKEIVWDGKTQYQTIYQDITERKRAEEAVKARLRIAAAVNTHSLKELMQLTLDEIEARTGSMIGFYHFLSADQETVFLQTWSTNTLRNMCTAEGEGRHYPISQAGVWVDCIHERRPVIHNHYDSLPHRKGLPPGHAPILRELVVPVFRNDRIVAILGVGNKPTEYNACDIDIISLLGDFSWEIVERKRAEDALRENAERLQLLFENMTEGVAVHELIYDETGKAKDYRILNVNRAFEIHTGIAAERALGSLASEIYGTGHAPYLEEYTRVAHSGEPLLLETYFPPLEKHFIISVIPHGRHRFATVFMDISERKRAEDNIKASLLEKEVLLKEIHHRVKNNLQIIISLLRLNSRYSGDERTKAIFRETQDRIRAMAAVHSLLYKSTNLNEINFGAYIRETARQLFRSYNTNPETISLSINAEDVMLSLDTAIPSGLIVNELISNALKHAFPDGKGGNIRIEIKKDENGVGIIFEDNGVGFQEGMDFRNTETMGLQLVNMLVAQLGGSIDMVGNGGTRYMITLKTERPQG